ncbi:MAG: tetratricopeptide repeat protein [Bacteroidaceae bacterium]|nr:tetratricopeptide repeat protein [Bacteroidaceae bacterium]
MKNKKFIIAAMCMTLSASTFAQELSFKDKTLEERIGYSNNNNEDSIKIGRSNVSLFQQSLANQDWAGAYENFSWLIKNAPFAINGIYTQGPFMFYNLIKNEQDKEKKLKYFNEMMSLFDARQKNIDVINTFANTTSTLGDVLSVKAEYYNWTAPVVEGSAYTLNKAYANFSDAIKMVNEQGGREITGTFLHTFFLVSDAMYKSAPNALREQYLQDYLDSKDACERMLQLAKEAKEAGDEERAKKLVATYDAPLAAIEQAFSESGAADSAQIVKIYTKKLEDYKADKNKLNSALTVMAQNDCDNTDIYYQYAEAAYSIEPTYTSAIGLAQKAQRDGEAEKMLEYYEKALELSSSDANRGIICLNISNSLIKSKSFTGALTYAERAIQYNADLAGKAYLKEANVYTQLGQYKDAIEYCTKAADSDITVSGTANRLKENIQRVQANQAANDKARREYEEYIARQKAEEEFWTRAAKK